MMIELNSEELISLDELTNVRSSGDDVSDFIRQRLYEELSHAGEPDAMGEREFFKHPGYDEQYSVYQSLAEKGLLNGHKMPHSVTMSFGDLTSEGRCYLSDRKAHEEAKLKELRSQRAHDYKIAAFGILGGLFSGALGSWLFSMLSGAINSLQA